MLENDIQIKLHIQGIDISPKEQETIKHLIKEHYAIELYKKQKEFQKCKNKIITLFCLGFVIFGCYLLIHQITNFEFILEILSFVFSFSLWEACNSVIYSYIPIKKEREAITQNLLTNIIFDKK